MFSHGARYTEAQRKFLAVRQGLFALRIAAVATLLGLLIVYGVIPT